MASTPATGGFVEPTWTAPLNVADYLAGVPSDAAAKGMFFTCITRLAKERSGEQLGREHYTAFKSYPIREWLELLPQCAQRAFPSRPLRSALFEMGTHIYRTFAESTVGRVVMSVAGRDVHAALKLATRAYDSVDSYGSVKLAELEARRAVIELRKNWEFADCYHAGVLAGGVRAFGEAPQVRVRVLALCDVDIELSW